jgi:phosphoglycerol transferase MdoB-like AlkP superfamily enzyme
VLKEKSVRLNYIPIIVACLFMVIYRVLRSATEFPQYTSYAGRFYMYQMMNAVVMIGINIFPIYLGFHAEKLKKKNIFPKLGNYFLIYMLTALSANVFFYIVKGSLNMRDYWMIFFPISQNNFGFAVSCMFALLFLPKLITWLNNSSDQQILQGITLTSILFVVLPTLFSKDLWGFQDGKSILWVLYLVFVGYCLKRLNISGKVRFPIVHLIFSVVLLIASIFFMTKVSLLMRDNAGTAARFCVPFSLFGMYYTLSLFISMESRKKLKWLVSTNFIADTLITNQVLLNFPLVTYIISTFYKRSYPESGMQWLKAISFFIVAWFSATVLTASCVWILQKTRAFQWIERPLRVYSLADIKAKGKTVFLWLVRKKRLIYTAVFFYVFTLVQMFLISESKLSVSVSDTVNAYAFILLKRQAPILLNVLIIMLFFIFLFIITNRFWHTFIFTVIVDLIITIANYLKISMRQEPILPSDLKMLSGINEILNMINPIILIIGLIVIGLLSVSSYLLERRAKRLYHLKVSWKKRIILLLVILTFFSSLLFVNHKNSPAYLFFNLFRINRYFYNQKLGAQINGPIVQFLNNTDVMVMEKPKDYSKETIDKIMKKYDLEAEKMNRDRTDWAANETIIFNLSESFSDPTRVPNLTIDSDPMPYIRQLMKKTTGGLMLSNGYGGGTANMEWGALTSLDVSNLSPTLPTPYTQLVKKQTIAPNITNLFDESIAIHPYVATLYNRKNVFKKFGFDKFYYVDSPDKLKYQDTIDDNIYISDLSAYNETLDKLKSNLSSKQFIQLSTMQNHMPYKDYYQENRFSFSGSAVVKGRESELNTYMQGMYYTDEAVRYFIQELDKINKPITFVFYGDHLPSLYSGNNMAKYGLELHQTDYFIYSNRCSRERSKQLKKEIVSPYNFSALALEHANLKVSSFYALMTKVTDEVLASTTDPAASVSNNYNGQKVFVTDEDQILLEENLTKKQKKILEDYRLIQYDLTAGNEYAAKWATQPVQ